MARGAMTVVFHETGAMTATPMAGGAMRVVFHDTGAMTATPNGRRCHGSCVS
jgi:hypothetical protein